MRQATVTFTELADGGLEIEMADGSDVGYLAAQFHARPAVIREHILAIHFAAESEKIERARAAVASAVELVGEDLGEESR